MTTNPFANYAAEQRARETISNLRALHVGDTLAVPIYTASLRTAAHKEAGRLGIRIRTKHQNGQLWICRTE